MSKQVRTEKQRTKVSDEIKDGIDRLHEIPARYRKAAARDLIEYIQLHHGV